jgi:hypothetical protein
MRLKFLIAEPDARRAAELRAAIGTKLAVEVVVAESRDVRQRVDAFSISLVAAERFGSKPHGTIAEVLDTGRRDGWSEFVVAGGAVSEANALDPGAAFQATLLEIVHAVLDFNKREVQRKIRTVGLGGEWFGLGKLGPTRAGNIFRQVLEDEGLAE